MLRYLAHAVPRCVHTGTMLAAGLLMAVHADGAPATGPTTAGREQRLTGRRDARTNEEIAAAFRAADTTFMVGDNARAAEMFQRVLAMAPSSPFVVRAHARLGDCAYEQKQYTDAVTHYRRATAAGAGTANPDEQTAAVRSDYMIGQSYLQAKQYTQCFSQFRRFIDRRPGDALLNQAYQAIGDAHLAMEQYQQALAAYRMVGTVIEQKTSAHRRVVPGQRLYLRVSDADVNVGDTLRSVTARIRTTGGDEEIVELEPLGLRSPVFIATIPTALGTPRRSGQIKATFSEDVASQIRTKLADADRLEVAARAKSEEAFEIDRSPEKSTDPAGTEKRRAALAAEAERLNARSAALRKEACTTIDRAFAAYEKMLEEWTPERSLAAIKSQRATTRPATAPGTDDEEGAGRTAADEALRAAATQPLRGSDEDDAPPPVEAEAERRGLTEGEIAQMRLAASAAPTTIDNIDTRLTAISVWSRSLQRQFQRLELSGRDRIEITYFDEIGAKGRNQPEQAIRRDVMEVAADARLDVLTLDGHERVTEAIVNGDILIEVEDADADVSDKPDEVTVVLAAVPVTDKLTEEIRAALRPETQPATRRIVPGEATTGPTSRPEIQPLAPEGCASIRLRLTETGTHTGIFRRTIRIGAEQIDSDAGAVLSVRPPGKKEGYCALRAAYADVRAVRQADGWVLARLIDLSPGGGGDVAAVKYRQTNLDLEAKLRRAAAAGELGKIYLDLGLDRRGRAYLASAQADCNEVARAAAKSELGEQALYYSWRIYFYAGLLDDAVAACRTLMGRYPSSDYIDDAMFAMGQASLQRGQREVEQANAAGEKPTLNRDLARAISQFEELVRRFGNSPLAPEALYNIGQAKILAGQTGLEVFERLAKLYPDSVFSARGLIRVAAYYMSVGDNRRAAEYYSRVLVDYPDSPNMGEVTLQRGICQYKLGQYPEALQSLYRVTEDFSGGDLAAQARKYINFINQKRGLKDE